jgi:hypothetical protein
VSSPRYFSIANGYSIGSFEAAYGMVHSTMSAGARELWQHPHLADGMDQKSPDFFLRLLEITSRVHEKRHFFDTFGTVAGLSLFTSHQDCIERFAMVSRQLVASHIPWQLPLSNWLKQQDCPAEVRQFARHLRSYKTAYDMFSGNFSSKLLPGSPCDTWVDIPVYGGADKPWTIPAFPLSIGSAEVIKEKDSAPFTDLHNATHYTAFQPIGYKSLVEGAAHLIARTMIDTRFASVDPQLLGRYGPGSTLHSNDGEDADLRAMAELIGTYGAVDLMVSRFMRRYAIARFERTSVFKLIDIALSSAELILADAGQHTTMAVMSNPGQVLVNQLGSIGIAALYRATFDYPDGIGARYDHLLKRFKSDVKWTKIQHRTSIYAAPFVWRSFLSNKVIVPLLERRLKTRHAIFYQVEAMFKDMDQTPLPHVDVINNQLSFKAIPELVKDAWMWNMMLSEIAHQVFSDNPALRCPRAHHMLPGMKSLDLTIDRSRGGCQHHIARGCGSWSTTRTMPLPDCLFRRTLTSYGFIPIVSEP